MKNILITLTLILCVNIIHAQSHDNWKNYTYSQRVMAIDVDGDSIWISTMGGGLIKYTKHSPTTGEKTIYNRANANLPDNNLLGACNAGNGNVWVTAKYYGTGMLNDAGCTIFNQSNSGLPFDQYNTSVKVDNQGNVWIASSEWMTKYDGAEWKTWKTGSDLSAWPIVSAFDITSDGIVWLYSTDGIGKIENDEYSIVSEIGSGLIAGAGAIKVDANDTVWFAIDNKGLYKYDGTSFINYNKTNSCLPSNTVYNMDFDMNNNLWLASDELYKFSPDTCNTLELPGDRIFTVKYDTSGAVWFGTFDGDLLHFDGTYLTFINLSNSPLKSKYAHPIFVDNDNHVWSNSRVNTVRSTDSGLEEVFNKKVSAGVVDYNGSTWLAFETGDTCLLKIENNETTIYDAQNSPFIDDGTRPVDILVDNNNMLWMATGNGLYTFDGTDFTRYTTENSAIPFNSIWNIAFDQDNNIWGGSAQGLFKFDVISSKVWNTENSTIPTNVVKEVIVDSDNMIWFACMDEDRIVGGEYGGGLTKFDGQKMTTYTMANSGLRANTIFGILEACDKLWLATYGAGLMSFDKTDQWEAYHVTNSGIAENLVQGLVKDNQGNLWMGHINAGISVFNPEKKINSGPVTLMDTAVIIDTINEPGLINSVVNFYDNGVKNEASPIIIYPNPVKDELFVKWVGQHENVVKATIYDTSGKMLQVIPAHTLKNDGSIMHFQVQPGLPAGQLLILSLRTKQGNVISGIFIRKK